MIALLAAAATLFGGGDGDTSRTLNVPARGPGLLLIDGSRNRSESNAAAFDLTAPGPHAAVSGRMEFVAHAGSHGGGLLLLPSAAHGASGAAPPVPEWEGPNLAGAFGIGFDMWDPPTANWYDENGNFYNRTQRIVSLHWDGKEVARKRVAADFADGQPAAAEWRLRHVPGGAFATVSLRGAPVFEEFFIAGLAPYESRLAVGARSGTATTSWQVGRVQCEWSEPAAAAEPVRVRTLDREVAHAGRQRDCAYFDLPEVSGPVERIVAVFSLECPDGGCDPWDRGGAIHIWDGNERLELLRFMTPYGRGYTWRVDATDFAPLLKGRTRIGFQCDTWMGEMDDPAQQKGWLVSLDLEYWPGKESRPLAIRNVWSGMQEYGNPAAPLDTFFVPRSVEPPAGATRAKVRVTVTGHGQHPATANAAEFLPADRTLTVNGTRHENRLWTTDCDMNAVRPQGGTWKFDRAGWCPGSVVGVWEVDATAELLRDGKLQLEYKPMPFTNENHAEQQAWHWIEVQAVFW